MVAVFSGSGAKGAFYKTVIRVLAQKSDILEISPFKISGNSTSPITVVFTTNKTPVSISGSVVFLNRFKGGVLPHSMRYLICDSCVKRDLEVARACPCEVITCGLSLRDSITFSSYTQEKCVISLQRSIRRFDGNIVEPFELPIDCREEDDKYGILAAHLFLILLGKI